MKEREGDLREAGMLRRRVDSRETNPGLLQRDIHHLLLPNLIHRINHPLRHIIRSQIIRPLLLSLLLPLPDDGLKNIRKPLHPAPNALCRLETGREKRAEEPGELANLLAGACEIGHECCRAFYPGWFAAGFGSDEDAAHGHGDDAEELVVDGGLCPVA